MTQKITDVDAYIAAAPEAVQPILRELRQVIKTAAPHATEMISYGMPSYDQHGRVAYFAGFAGHVGLYGVAHVASEHDDDVPDSLKTRARFAFQSARRCLFP